MPIYVRHLLQRWAYKQLDPQVPHPTLGDMVSQNPNCRILQYQLLKSRATLAMISTKERRGLSSHPSSSCHFPSTLNYSYNRSSTTIISEGEILRVSIEIMHFLVSMEMLTNPWNYFHPLTLFVFCVDLKTRIGQCIVLSHILGTTEDVCIPLQI